jgi:hypothetical protein
MMLIERKTLHSAHCPECGEILSCEFSDEELRQLIAGTLSFTCPSSGSSWPPTKDEKDAFVEILLSS